MERLFYPDSETLYLQPGTAPVQRVGSIVGPRFTKYQRAIAKLEESKTDDLVQTTERSPNPEINLAAADPIVLHDTRVKKFRHVHTIRPASDTGILETGRQSEAMGDNRCSANDDEKIGKPIDDCSKNFSKMTSTTECSGDSSANHVEADDNLLIERFSKLGNDRITGDKSLKRQREPYRLHRTQKCMNLRLEAIDKNDNSVTFLVKPRPPSFASSLSDSDDDTQVICKKYSSNLNPSVPVALVRPTSESFDHRFTCRNK